MEKISIKAKSDIRKSARGRAYFTVEDFEGNTYVCFVASQHPDFIIGKELEVEITPSSKPDSSPSIKIASVESTEEPAKEYKEESKYKADPDKTRSIQNQSAMKGAIELCVGGKIETNAVRAWTIKLAELLRELE